MATVKHVENVPQTQLDTNMAKTKPVKLGWKPEQIDKISHALNSVLANYSIHFQKLRNFHWNVTGSDFFDLHLEFEAQYKEAAEHTDEIAERIRVFGETPFSTMKEYLDESEIKESSSTQIRCCAPPIPPWCGWRARFWFMAVRSTAKATVCPSTKRYG